MTCFTAQKNLLRPRFFEAAFRSFFIKMGVFGQALFTHKKEAPRETDAQ